MLTHHQTYLNTHTHSVYQSHSTDFNHTFSVVVCTNTGHAHIVTYKIFRMFVCLLVFGNFSNDKNKTVDKEEEEGKERIEEQNRLIVRVIVETKHASMLLAAREIQYLNNGIAPTQTFKLLLFPYGIVFVPLSHSFTRIFPFSLLSLRCGYFYNGNSVNEPHENRTKQNMTRYIRSSNSGSSQPGSQDRYRSQSEGSDCSLIFIMCIVVYFTS